MLLLILIFKKHQIKAKGISGKFQLWNLLKLFINEYILAFIKQQNASILTISIVDGVRKIVIKSRNKCWKKDAELIQENSISI